MYTENFFSRNLGVSGSDLVNLWKQYGPTVVENAKLIKEQVSTQAPSASKASAFPAPASYSSFQVPERPVWPTAAAVLIGLGVLGGGGYYLWKTGIFKRLG